MIYNIWCKIKIHWIITIVDYYGHARGDDERKEEVKLTNHNIMAVNSRACITWNPSYHGDYISLNRKWSNIKLGTDHYSPKNPLHLRYPQLPLLPYLEKITFAFFLTCVRGMHSSSSSVFYWGQRFGVARPLTRLRVGGGAAEKRNFAKYAVFAEIHCFMPVYAAPEWFSRTPATILTGSTT